MTQMKKISIIDYSIGNLHSVVKAFSYIGADAYLITDPVDVANADRLILPGVGSFGQCIKTLNEKGFSEGILKFIEKERPLLGICVGMQLLFSKSFEQGEFNGLDIISGSVHRIGSSESATSVKVPHVGWKRLANSQDIPLLNDVDPKESFYFTHSYNAQVCDPEAKVAITHYSNNKITALVKKNSTLGCQFHPEKSRAAGLKVLNNFLNL